MDICIYSVHLFLYKCITCKVKSCQILSISYFLCYQKYKKIQNNYKIPLLYIQLFLMDILLLLLVRPKIFINITSDVFHCHAPGKDLLKCLTHPLQ